MYLDELSSLATGRTTELFLKDIEDRNAEIAERIGGKRVLIIGGAGSIGSATVHAMLDYHPDALHIVDTNENNLAELIRDLRSSVNGLKISDFRCLPLDYGSPIMHRYLRGVPPYDFVLNFAAIKHVRSEKDVYSTLQMLDTNIVKSARILRWLQEKGSLYRYFCVSTDKAANPVNLMGASKRIMEHVIFSGEVVPNLDAYITSARFANVAFSEGSLLQSFLKRMEKRQSLAVPKDTRRFFISLREAGQICLLASVCAPNRHLVIPRLEPDNDLHDLEEIAVQVLQYNNYEPRKYDDESVARANVESDMAEGCYPLLVTSLDTSGEKPYEEFVGSGESSVEIGMSNLLGVSYRPASTGSIADFLDQIEGYISEIRLTVSKDDIVNAIAAVIPEFRHIESGRNLDERM